MTNEIQTFTVTIKGKCKRITKKEMVEYLEYGFMGDYEGKIVVKECYQQ